MIKVATVLIVHDKRQNIDKIKNVKYAIIQYCIAFKTIFKKIEYHVVYLLKSENWCSQ